MAAPVIDFAKILFCSVHLICNLAQEFNGLVSKQDWLFPRPVLFIFEGLINLSINYNTLIIKLKKNLKILSHTFFHVSFKGKNGIFLW